MTPDQIKKHIDERIDKVPLPALICEILDLAEKEREAKEKSKKLITTYADLVDYSGEDRIC